MSLLARFIAANQRLCKATENHLPQVFKRHIQTLYKYQVAALLNRRPGQVVLDIGGGKECPFLPYTNAPRTHLIIALDISEEELRHNRGLDHKVVADAAARGLPFRDGLVDLVVSRPQRRSGDTCRHILMGGTGSVGLGHPARRAAGRSSG
jgi:hypothetical protein